MLTIFHDTVSLNDSSIGSLTACHFQLELTAAVIVLYTHNTFVYNTYYLHGMMKHSQHVERMKRLIIT